MEEVWKDVVGYEGLYKVSNFGKVTQNKRIIKIKGGHKTEINAKIKTHINIYGYEVISLALNGKQKLFQVHRLVASAFLGNPLFLPTVNHVDENKTNNIVSNLEWCTHQYNSLHGTGRQRKTDTYKNNLENRKKVPSCPI